MAQCNLLNLPENYQLKYCQCARSPSQLLSVDSHLLRADLYHGLTWPQLSFVAQDPKGRIVGYILAKMSVSFESLSFLCVCACSDRIYSQGGGGTARRASARARHIHICPEILPSSGPRKEAHGPISCVLFSFCLLNPSFFYRKLKLSFEERAMKDVFGAAFVSLHVRETNRAALALYRDTLGFEVSSVEKGYCKLLSCLISLSHCRFGVSHNSKKLIL
jgi:hypothetical protein